MICLAMDTIDDLILYLGSKEKHFRYLNRSFNDNVRAQFSIDGWV